MFVGKSSVNIWLCAVAFSHIGDVIQLLFIFSSQFRFLAKWLKNSNKNMFGEKKKFFNHVSDLDGNLDWD